MDIYARLLTAIESQQANSYRTLLRREEADRNQQAHPAQIVGYNASDGQTIAATPGDGIVRGRSLTNASLSGFAGYFSGDIGFIDSGSLV